MSFVLFLAGLVIGGAFAALCGEIVARLYQGEPVPRLYYAGAVVVLILTAVAGRLA